MFYLKKKILKYRLSKAYLQVGKEEPAFRGQPGLCLASGQPRVHSMILSPKTTSKTAPYIYTYPVFSSFKRECLWPAFWPIASVVHTYNASTCGAEIGGLLQEKAHGLLCEFQGSICNVVRPCVEQPTKPHKSELWICRTQALPTQSWVALGREKLYWGGTPGHQLMR